ncbi:hypothetical protein NC661_05385 [Aquibacillus koreensis]|uniref:Uncharacterized protein n=1 Tax=Aquibacillus koreensis TaxID=279446 RepID=A0A9X4AHK4_9BACI|nr:hypothetical protein [Aquibacillus koreensis]MCT2534615.1 hypothetical protein [Aquibacillus koreensis]MDC3419799.1 hypothetical protein [Aquibacillus koreensis]
MFKSIGLFIQFFFFFTVGLIGFLFFLYFVIPLIGLKPFIIICTLLLIGFILEGAHKMFK